MQEADDILQKNITNTNYADDITLLAKAPAKVELLVRSLEHAAKSADLDVNSHKKELLF